MKYIFFIPFISIILFNCSNDKVVDEDKFVKAYTDIVIAQDTIPLTKPAFDSVRQSIFHKHGITSDQYDSTVRYYNQDVKRWEGFFEKATAYIDTMRSKK